MTGDDSELSVLVVDDDAAILRTLLLTLKSLGCRAVGESGGEAALAAVEKQAPDLLLTDMRMEGMSGVELTAAALERRPDLICVLMTAFASYENAVEAIKAGAYDYLPKPFHLAELNARIKSVIRRQRRDGEMDIRLANIRIVPDTFQVFVDDKEIELNRKEYDILLYFANRPGRLVNKNTLAESVWGDHIDQVDNFDFIYAQIKNLRKKLKDAGALAELKAVYGFGYKMTVE